MEEARTLCRQSGDGDEVASDSHWALDSAGPAATSAQNQGGTVTTLPRPGWALPGGKCLGLRSGAPFKVFLYLNVASRLESQEQLSTREHSVATLHMLIRNL